MIHNFGMIGFYPNSQTINFTIPDIIHYSLSTPDDTLTQLIHHDYGFSLCAHPSKLIFILKNLPNSEKHLAFSCSTSEESIHINIYKVDPESENTCNEHLIHSTTIHKQKFPPYTNHAVFIPSIGYTITVSIDLNNSSNPHITICYERITKGERR